MASWTYFPDVPSSANLFTPNRRKEFWSTKLSIVSLIGEEFSSNENRNSREFESFAEIHKQVIRYHISDRMQSNRSKHYRTETDVVITDQ